MTKLTLKTFIDSDDNLIYNAISPDNLVIASSSNKKEIQTIIDKDAPYSGIGCPTYTDFKKAMQN